MSKLDLLLKVDKTKLVRPTQEVEIKRLSDLVGETFTVTCQALTPDEFGELQNSISIEQNGQVSINDDIQVETVINGVKDPQLDSQQVIEYYGAVNAKEVVKIIFLPGEINSLYQVISNLSGFGRDAVKEIKNS
jgi:hypothetical protein